MANNKSNKTQFAPNPVVSDEVLKVQSTLFAKNKILINLANSLSQMLVVLNGERQIIYANNLFLSFLGLTDNKGLIGNRVGNALKCIHAFSTENGCGTTEFCKTCGAVNAILESQTDRQSEKECRITTTENEALDLKVTATPYYHEKEMFTIFAISDISNEKRRQTLERVFFHDVLNSAGGISGLSGIMQEIHDPEEITEIAQTINRAADNLIGEIRSQRQLSAAERGDLELEIKEINSLIILNDLKGLYSKHEIAKDKKIVISNVSEDINISTDPVLLRRILGNMIKNACEASLPESEITIGCKKTKNKARFSVHNNTFIERKIQLQLFNRSFSTKGIGRGVGTYSMKLLGEKYLKGKVWFKSTPENGTTFYFEI